MANVNIGKVALTPAGDYNSTSTYEKLDIVKDQGSSFIAKKAVPVGTTTGNDEYWQMVASIGATGPTGPQGPIGHTIEWGEIEGNIEDQEDLNTSLSTLNNTKEDLIIKSASGSIVSFDDSTDYSLADLKINIEPVQDLHGYDNPWPAGGSANVWDEQWELGTFDSQGNPSGSSTSIRCKNFIPVVPGNTYRYVNNTGSSQAPWLYDENQGFIQRWGSYMSSGATITIPSGCYYIKFALPGTYGATYKNDVSWNYPSTVTTYQPYSNICPINGYNTTTVTRTGKNLLIKSSLAESWDGVDGNNFTRTAINNYNQISLYGTDGLHFTTGTSGNAGGNGVGFKINLEQFGIEIGDVVTFSCSIKGTVSGSSSTGLKYYHSTPSNNTYYAAQQMLYNIQNFSSTSWQRISGSFTVADTGQGSNKGYAYIIPCIAFNAELYVKDIQLEFGSIANPYEDNNKVVLTIDLDGTRYGGVFDVLTGELTVDRVIFERNTSTMNNSEDYPGWRSSGLKQYYGNGVNTTIYGAISNIFGLVDSGHKYCSFNSTNDTVYLAKALFGNKTQTEWIAEAVDVQIVCPLVINSLDARFTVQLSPSQISTLLGTNNIWADTGDTNVKYWTLPSKDITTALDNKLNEVIHEQQQLITNIEPNMKASNNYVIGNLVIVKNRLLRVTQNISSGSNFVIDSNVEQVNLTTIISEKASQSSVNTALAAKAPLASPTLTGTPTAPTPIESDSSTKIATTEFVQNITEKKQNLIINSASGSIASFSDGSASPVTALSVSIEPVQDLHGYDNPWPAGGGKNLLNPSLLVVGTFKPATGEQRFDVNNRVCTQGMFFIKAGTYTVSVTSNQQIVIYVYDVDGTYFSSESLTDWNNSNNRTITLTEDRNISVAFRFPNDGVITVADVVNPQIESGSSVTSYAPYSNICPISGWDEAVVTRTGKNVFATPFVASNGWTRIIRNPLPDGGKLTFSVANQVGVGTTYGFAIYATNSLTSSSDGVLVSDYGFGNSSLSRTRTIPAGYKYFRLGFQKGGADINELINAKFQIEEGETATPYEEPANSITIDLDGTRYGGVLDVLTGQMTVDRAIIDLSTCSWETYSSTYKVWNSQDIQNVVKRPETAGTLAEILCDTYPNVTWNELFNNRSDPNFIGMTIGSVSSTSDGGKIRIRNGSSTNTPTGQLVYKLKTPFIVQLTQSQLSTLLGENRIWADTGDVTVKYWKQSSQDLVDAVQGIVKQSQYATRSIIGGIERTNIATKNYVVGEYVIVGDDLLKVTSNISSGETLSIETNCVKTTVAEALIALASA